MKYWLTYSEQQRRNFCGMSVWDIASIRNISFELSSKLKKISISFYGEYGNIY